MTADSIQEGLMRHDVAATSSIREEAAALGVLGAQWQMTVWTGASRRLPSRFQYVSHSGVSTHERAKYAWLYLEAAANRPEESRIANSPSIKHVISEFVLSTSIQRQRGKKQAPQIPAAILIRIEINNLFIPK